MLKIIVKLLVEIMLIKHFEKCILSKAHQQTMPERPGTPPERCALKNWCGKVPESIRFDLDGASYGNFTETLSDR